MKKSVKFIFLISLVLVLQIDSFAYPYDGYYISGIRRLVRLHLIMIGAINEQKPVEGAQLKLSEIKLNLMNEKGDSLETFPKPDPELQKSINALFPNLDESYSVCLLDITQGKPLRYACRQEKGGLCPEV